LLLATFSEAEAGVFWANFLDGPNDPFPAAGVPKDLLAPKPLVAEALRQLEQLHGVSVPPPYWAAFIDWSVDRTAASYHFWRPGYRSWEVIPRIGNPLPGMYVSGEASSTNQAWVEGALDNSEETLQLQFGLAPPEGISPSYRPANFRGVAQATARYFCFVRTD
jgi:monoamine oxidase